MKTKIPKYLFKLIQKHPSILNGRKKTIDNHQRIIKTKKLIQKYKLKKISNT